MWLIYIFCAWLIIYLPIWCVLNWYGPKISKNYDKNKILRPYNLLLFLLPIIYCMNVVTFGIPQINILRFWLNIFIIVVFEIGYLVIIIKRMK